MQKNLLKKILNLPRQQNVGDGAHSVKAKDDDDDEHIAQQGAEDDGNAEDGAQNAKHKLAAADVRQAGQWKVLA